MLLVGLAIPFLDGQFSGAKKPSKTMEFASSYSEPAKSRMCAWQYLTARVAWKQRSGSELFTPLTISSRLRLICKETHVWVRAAA